MLKLASTGWQLSEDKALREYPGASAAVYAASGARSGLGRRHPKALVSVVLNARERQSRLQRSIKNPLKCAMVCFGTGMLEVTAEGAIWGGGRNNVASKASLYVARTEQRRERADIEGRKAR